MEENVIVFEKRFVGDKVFENVGKQVELLCKAGNSCIITYADVHGDEFVEIAHAPLDYSSLSSLVPMYLTYEEAALINNKRKGEEDTSWENADVS